MHFPHFTSWRTSLTGAGALVFAAADLITMFHNKDWDSNRLGVSVMAILTGLGLISARDSAASVQAHAVQTVEIAQNAVGLAEVKADAVVAKEVAVVAKEEVAAVKQEVAAIAAVTP
jgi:hypothetical protein